MSTRYDTHSFWSFCVSNNHNVFVDAPNKSQINKQTNNQQTKRKKKRAMKWKITTTAATKHSQSDANREKAKQRQKHTAHYQNVHIFFVVTKYTTHYTFIATTVLNLWINCRLSLVTVIQCCTYSKMLFMCLCYAIWMWVFQFFFPPVCGFYNTSMRCNAWRYRTCQIVSHIWLFMGLLRSRRCTHIFKNCKLIQQLNWFVACADNNNVLTNHHLPNPLCVCVWILWSWLYRWDTLIPFNVSESFGHNRNSSRPINQIDKQLVKCNLNGRKSGPCVTSFFSFENASSANSP